jgi:hypothetical protein
VCISSRLSEIKNLIVVLKEFNSDDRKLLVGVLFETYPLYGDRKSQDAALSALREVLRQDSELFSKLGDALRTESNKLSLAPSNYYVLTLWNCACVEELGKDKELWEKHASNYIQALAASLEKTCSTKKHGISHSAIVRTRRALRATFGNSPLTITATVDILAKKQTTPASRNAVLLGVVAGVSARKEPFKAVLLKEKKVLLGYYTREIIGSKTPLLPHIARGLDDFFERFVTVEDLDSEIVPAMEKAMLRAPEIVFNNLVEPMVLAIGPGLDMSASFQKLLKGIMSNLKSTNSDVRGGVLKAFQALASKSHDEAILDKIVDEVLNPLKQNKVPVADQKVIHAQMLSSIPDNSKLAQKISSGLTPLALKEANEPALDSLLEAVQKHFLYAVEHKVPLETTVVDAFSKGLTDKRASAKRIWASHFGTILWNVSPEGLRQEQMYKFIISLFNKVPDILKEVAANPIAATQSGLASAACAFIVVGLTSLQNLSNPEVKAAVKQDTLLKSAIAWDGKPSFLLNPKVVTKPTTKEELTWFTRALISVLDFTEVFSKPDYPEQVGVFWSQALIFFLTSNIPPAVHLELVGLIRDAYWRNPDKLGPVLINGLWSWLEDVNTGEKESLAIISRKGSEKLSLILKCMTNSATEFTPDDIDVEKVIRAQLIDLLVLARDQLVPGISWINLCLKLRVDPGELVTSNATSCIDQIKQCPKVCGFLLSSTVI